MEKHRAKTRMQENERAEMGVGTLIVFIAMIIVAAVAATVLVTTAYEMQQQAEHTGDIAMRDIATGYKVINVGGDRDNPNDAAGNQTTIQILEIKVGLLAGSPAISVSDTIIEITDGTVDITLTYVDATTSEYNVTASATQFTIQPLRDMAPTNSSLTSGLMTSGDVGLIFIDANACGLSLSTQTTCEIKIIPKHGIPTLESFTTPAVYTDRYLNF